MSGLHVALLLNNPFASDSRSWKLARSLTEAGYRVSVVARPGIGLPAREEVDGFVVLRIEPPEPRWAPAPRLPSSTDAGPPGPDTSTYVRRVAAAARRLGIETVGRAAQASRYARLTSGWAGRIAEAVPSADLWQAEGLITLPVALHLARRVGGRAVYDSRDVHVESARFARLPGPWRAALRRRERRLAQRCDAVITVSEPYARVLTESLGVRPVIVMNGPLPWEPPDPPRRDLGRGLGIPPNAPILLYLGQVAPGRGIENLIEAMPLIKGGHLVIAGFGSGFADIQVMVGSSPVADRIHLMGRVAPVDIPTVTADADVAVVPVLPTTLNHVLNTPTKLFDAMGAGVPVVASDLPGMASIVRSTGCGELCDPTDPADIARAVLAIIEAPADRRRAYGAAGLQAVRAVYGWERQFHELLELYRRIGVA